MNLHNWMESPIQSYKKEVFLFLFLGFISGIPFLLVLSTLAFWLSELKIPNTIIGVFMFTTIPYSLKPLWAPCIDNFNIPFLGRFLDIKYSWGIFSNILLTISIVGLGFSNPQHNLGTTIFFALLVSFCAATQDIVIDTLRIELTPYHLSGIVAAAESIGFRTGMLTSGAGALYIAEYFSWPIAYSTMGCIVIFGSLVFWLLCRFPIATTQDQTKGVISDNRKSFNSSFIAQILPSKYKLMRLFFYSFYNITSQQYFLSIIAFIFFFKVADSSLNAMSAPFIYDLGFSKIEYANISKFFGTAMMVCGSMAGGFWVNRWNALLCLKLYGFLQIMSACMFIIQTYMGHNNLCLILTLGLESFVSGFGSVGFLAYLSRFCSSSFTATSFTVLYSFGSLFRVLISLAAGWCADHLGWTMLFCLVILFTIPIFYCLKRIEKLFGIY